MSTEQIQAEILIDIQPIKKIEVLSDVTQDNQAESSVNESVEVPDQAHEVVQDADSTSAANVDAQAVPSDDLVVEVLVNGETNHIIDLLPGNPGPSEKEANLQVEPPASPILGPVAEDSEIQMTQVRQF